MLVLSKMDKNPYITLAWSIRWTVSVKNARYIQYKDMRDRWKAFRSDCRWIKRCIALNDIVDILEQIVDNSRHFSDAKGRIYVDYAGENYPS